MKVLSKDLRPGARASLHASARHERDVAGAPFPVPPIAGLSNDCQWPPSRSWPVRSRLQPRENWCLPSGI